MDSKTIIETVMGLSKFRGVVWLEELRMGTGWAKDNTRRIDLWGIEAFKASPVRTVAIEVKVSVSDFNRELADPTKRRGALLHSNQFYFAAPAGVINPKRLPPECGLIEVSPGLEPMDRHRPKIVVDAPFEERFPPSWTFLASVCRRVNDGSVVVAE